MRLPELQPGHSATIQTLEDDCALRRRLQDLGMIPGSKIYCAFRSPLGDPTAYRIRHTLIALRTQDAQSIQVQEDLQWKK